MATMDDIRTTPNDPRQYSPAAQRNRGPLLEILKSRLSPGARVLEIASGSGEHMVHFAREMPANEFTPSDMSPELLASIRAWRDVLYQEMPGVQLNPPLRLEVGQHPWPLHEQIDVMLCFNMIHIAPWQATLDLFEGAARYLESNGWLLLYGPFSRDGKHQADSNAAFDQSLKARDSRWGIRDLEQEVLPAAHDAGLALTEIIEMPANNLCVRLSRTAGH